jgi:hypothetical protein
VKWSSERGAIAALTLGILAVLSVLAGAWLRIVAAKLETASLDGRDIQAQSLADAGIEQVLAWFADPASVDPGIEAVQPGECSVPADIHAIFRKRCRAGDGLPAFRGSDGARQFIGTWEQPSVRVAWTKAAMVGAAPPSVAGDVRPARSVQTELRVFSPRSIDAVATVVSRASVDGVSAAVRVELMEGPWRGFANAVTTASLGENTIPVKVHWGTVAIDGTFDATALAGRLTLRDPLAPLDGLPYASEPGRDRWSRVIASGPVVGIPREVVGFAAPFEHVQEDVSIAPLGIWSYDALKAFARQHGMYYATRGTGLLYPLDGGPGVSPSAAMAANSGAGGLLFIDTMDGRAPNEDNLDTLDLAIEHVEADAYVGAHLRFAPGAGRPIRLDTPPSPGTDNGPPVASDLTVDAVHYHGTLIVGGDLSVTAPVRLVGALAALRGVRDAGGIEVWYEQSLRQGVRSGFPPVVVRPGTRRTIAVSAP